MKKNKIKKESVWSTRCAGIAALIICIFAVGIVYWWADSQCKSISSQIGRYEKELESAKRECQRESARWDTMLTLSALKERVTRSGLEMGVKEGQKEAMDIASVNNIVRIKKNGQVNSKFSIARISRRTANSVMAMASVSTPSAARALSTRAVRPSAARTRPATSKTRVAGRR